MRNQGLELAFAVASRWRHTHTYTLDWIFQMLCQPVHHGSLVYGFIYLHMV